MIPQNLDVAMSAHRPIQDDQVAPHSNPTITSVYGVSGLIIEDAGSPVTKVPDSMPLIPLMTPPMRQIKVSLGHLAGHRGRYPTVRSRVITVWIVICLPKRRIICIPRWGADMKRLSLLTIRRMWRCSLGVNILCLPHPPSDQVAPTLCCAASLRHTQNSRHWRWELPCVNKQFATKRNSPNFAAWYSQ